MSCSVIRLDPYQLLPLRKALRLPRVNLLIADDVGLGKTVEAGLVLRELLLRRRVDYTVVIAPPAMTGQWRDELQTKFGLSFEIVDAAHLESLRRRRGYGANPWAAGSRLILSHRLLGEEAYVAGLRDVLEDFRARSLLILDEAHHAAPAGGGRYAIESQFTRALRDLSDRFEHRLFLSATPHNGHPNSFATLLELLDPQRFTRGVAVRPADLEPVMVRRLKSDLRALGEAFPERVVEPVVLRDLPADTPELALAGMLADYRALRERRIGALSGVQAARARLAFVGLQQRLLSSIPAFARTLKVHLAGLERAIAGQAATDAETPEPEPPERASDEAVALDLVAAREAEVGAAGFAGSDAGRLAAEQAHARAMLDVAEAARTLPDARVRWILDWARTHLLGGAGRWGTRRLILFTEYEDTRRWLQRQLSALLDPEDAHEALRIDSFTGVTSTERREDIKRAFNDPAHALRILICTDAAREGINLQAQCHDLIHVDLPWNPSRLEQRNGRIDRKLQPADTVTCRYFVYADRPEDVVLDALVRKTELIRRQLGSAGEVIGTRIAERLGSGGIDRADARNLADRIRDAEADARVRAAVEELGDEAGVRLARLKREQADLAATLEKARARVGVDPGELQSVVGLALRRAGGGWDAQAPVGATPVFALDPAAPGIALDPSWQPLLDELRARPARPGERPGEWRASPDAGVRALSFAPAVLPDGRDAGDVVQLHLEHRLVRRLLGQFLSAGFRQGLARACVIRTAATPVPRVILLGRLALWGQLLALFRLVERGGEAGFMQARGGKLFDSRRFPFLLGRAGAQNDESVLPVGDGCVLRILDGLLMLAGERVHYRALSVEQIGSVYETVMGFTVERASGPMLAIRAGKHNKVPVWVDLTALAAAKPGEREKLLKGWTGRGTFGAGVSRALKAAADIDALAAALASVADPRASPRGQPVAAGVPILQPTDERRRTGSHYTPASLTRPIVTHALAPVFARIGADARPDEVLDLKVCDPAAGSGAFLVEACRQLGERLVAAWTRWPLHRPTIPADEDELLHAKRLVAQHCLRGVDRNPLAIDLAKLSLWLETLARDHEFTFLDGVLRCGDSLVGLPNPKIVAVTWGKVSGQHSFVEAIVRDGISAAAELRRLMRHEAEVAPYAAQERRHRAAAIALERAHLVADAILQSFFAGTGARDREARLAEVQQCVLAPSPASRARLAAWCEALQASPIGITSFHWELEFEDVFTRPNPGFDAIVGNPPFAGKNTIAAGHAVAYPDWLKALHPGAHGNADLAAHFFRRAFSLLRVGGTFGLIATNTIRQGDTRETGLARILAEGGTIYRAVSRHQWEGEAAVVVAQVFVQRAGTRDSCRSELDGRSVRRISAYLMDGEMDGSPARLRHNASTAFQGAILLGPGFTFDDATAAKGRAGTIAELQNILSARPDHADVVKPYIGGEEVNNSPRHAAHRYVMNLSAMTEAEARQRYPLFLARAEERVKPERAALPPTNAWNRDVAKRWWQFAADRKAIAVASRKMEYFLVHSCGATPHIAFARMPSQMCFANTLAVFALSSHAAFATLQSRVHEVWTRFFASTLEDRLRYTPSDCFETFPLPPGYADAPALEAAGGAYHDHRAALMVARDQGMTPTYNRFHRAADTADDIVALERML